MGPAHRLHSLWAPRPAGPRGLSLPSHGVYTVSLLQPAGDVIVRLRHPVGQELPDEKELGPAHTTNNYRARKGCSWTQRWIIQRGPSEGKTSN